MRNTQITFTVKFLLPGHLAAAVSKGNTRDGARNDFLIKRKRLTSETRTIMLRLQPKGI